MHLGKDACTRCDPRIREDSFAPQTISLSAEQMIDTDSVQGSKRRSLHKAEYAEEKLNNVEQQHHPRTRMIEAVKGQHQHVT